MSNFAKVKEQLSKYNFIRFAICDLNGVSRGPVIPVRHAEKFLTKGFDICEVLLMFGSEGEIMPVKNKRGYNVGNMNILPDFDTFRPIPWMGADKAKVAEVLCESRWKKDDSPQLACPRHVARSQLQKLEDAGYKLFSGFEIEFLLYHADTMEPIFPAGSWMDHRLHNKFREILFEYDSQLFESGVDVESFHTEIGPGQMEAAMKPTVGIHGADTAFNLKQGLQEISEKLGMRVSFLGKPDLKNLGSYSHFNQSLLAKDSGENVFDDESCPDGISAIAKHWIAGILKHCSALTVFYAPTPNCYRGLHTPYAPGEIFWGIEDREAFIRVKKHGHSGTYIENRIPNGKSNPYLVVAATVAAGLDGIINKLECPQQGSVKDAAAKDQLLPKSLPEAMKALREDKILVKALGEELVSWFLKVKELDMKKFENLSNDESFELEKKLYL